MSGHDGNVTCVFGVRQDGKITVKVTEAKKARGEMVCFIKIITEEHTYAKKNQTG